MSDEYSEEEGSIGGGGGDGGGGRDEHQPSHAHLLMMYPYIQFDNGTPERKRCAKLCQMDMGRGSYIDWDHLGMIGERARAEAILGQDTPWRRLFQVDDPAFREITVEFLSTFVFRPRRADQAQAMEEEGIEAPEVNEVSYSLHGHIFNESLRQFAVSTTLYTEAETRSPLYREAISEIGDDVLVAWWPAIGQGMFDKKARSTRIRYQ